MLYAFPFSCHARLWITAPRVTLHVRMRHIWHLNNFRLICERVMTRERWRARLFEPPLPSLTHQRGPSLKVMSHIWMSHILHLHHMCFICQWLIRGGCYFDLSYLSPPTRVVWRLEQIASHALACVTIYIFIYIYIHTHTNTHSTTNSITRACVRHYIYTYIYIYIYIYIYTHIHKYK